MSKLLFEKLYGVVGFPSMKCSESGEGSRAASGLTNETCTQPFSRVTAFDRSGCCFARRRRRDRHAHLTDRDALWNPDSARGYPRPKVASGSQPWGEYLYELREAKGRRPSAADSDSGYIKACTFLDVDVSLPLSTLATWRRGKSGRSWLWKKSREMMYERALTFSRAGNTSTENISPLPHWFWSLEVLLDSSSAHSILLPYNMKI